MKPYFLLFSLPFLCIIFWISYDGYKKNTKKQTTEEIITKILKENDLPSSVSLNKIAFDGHTYIYLRNAWNSAGNTFLHDPGCECQKK